ncbi:MAG: 50S ribosomal protein L6 [Nitrospiria bacterium]
MSRVGEKKILVPSGVTVKIDAGIVHVKGPKGELQKAIRPESKVAIEDGSVVVSRHSDEPRQKAIHGLARSEINNMVLGVSAGFEKVLEIKGVGYRVALKGRVLDFSLGYSHPIHFDLPQGIDAVVEKQTTLTIKGIDKYLVGQISANIRSLRKPEPYKGKGIKYRDEKILRKEGKTGK